MSEIIPQHYTGAAMTVSPDGLLRLTVRVVDGDKLLGFEGFPWHTHGDILRATSKGEVQDAVAHWIADLIGGKLVIAMSSIRGTVRDVWVTDDPTAELQFLATDEHVAFRLWDGTRLEP